MAGNPQVELHLPQIERITAHGVFETRLMYRVIFEDKTSGWIYSELLEPQIQKVVNYWETNPNEMRHQAVQNTNLTLGSVFFGKSMKMTQSVISQSASMATGLISPSSGAEIVEISRDKKRVKCVFLDETELTCSTRRAIMLFPTEFANFLADNSID